MEFDATRAEAALSVVASVVNTVKTTVQGWEEQHDNWAYQFRRGETYYRLSRL